MYDGGSAAPQSETPSIKTEKTDAASDACFFDNFLRMEKFPWTISHSNVHSNLFVSDTKTGCSVILNEMLKQARKFTVILRP